MSSLPKLIAVKSITGNSSHIFASAEMAAIASLITHDNAAEIVKRCNMHEELVDDLAETGAHRQQLQMENIKLRRELAGAQFAAKSHAATVNQQAVLLAAKTNDQ